MTKYQSVIGTDLHKRLWLYFDRIEMARAAIKQILEQYGVTDWSHDVRDPIAFPQAFRFGDNPVPDFFVWSDKAQAYHIEPSINDQHRSAMPAMFMRRLLEIRHIALERNLAEILAFEPYKDSDGNLVFTPRVTKSDSWDGVFVVEIDDDYTGHIHHSLSPQKDEQ